MTLSSCHRDARQTQTAPRRTAYRDGHQADRSIRRTTIHQCFADVGENQGPPRHGCAARLADEPAVAARTGVDGQERQRVDFTLEDADAGKESAA